MSRHHRRNENMAINVSNISKIIVAAIENDIINVMWPSINEAVAYQLINENSNQWRIGY